MCTAQRELSSEIFPVFPSCFLWALLACLLICSGHAFWMLIFFAKKIPEMNVTNSCGSQASHLHTLRNAVCLLLLVIPGQLDAAHKLYTVCYTWLISAQAIKMLLVQPTTSLPPCWRQSLENSGPMHSPLSLLLTQFMLHFITMRNDFKLKKFIITLENVIIIWYNEMQAN